MCCGFWNVRYLDDIMTCLNNMDFVVDGVVWWITSLLCISKRKQKNSCELNGNTYLGAMTNRLMKNNIWWWETSLLIFFQLYEIKARVNQTKFWSSFYCEGVLRENHYLSTLVTWVTVSYYLLLSFELVWNELLTVNL